MLTFFDHIRNRRIVEEKGSTVYIAKGSDEGSALGLEKGIQTFEYMSHHTYFLFEPKLGMDTYMKFTGVPTEADPSALPIIEIEIEVGDQKGSCSVQNFRLISKAVDTFGLRLEALSSNLYYASQCVSRHLPS